MSVQRGDLVAGRYRTGEPLGPAWRAHDEIGGGEAVLVPVARGDDATGGDTESAFEADIEASLDPDRWRDRRGLLPVTGTATGDAGAWLVAEPVAGRTLAQAVAQWGTLPSEQVLLIAAKAATALSAAGPRISAAPDHIILTDAGDVLLLPMETAENDLATLGTALRLASEDQRTLATLISGLLDEDTDRETALDRTFAELSRLGAPLDTPHGADALSAAQAASAAAADEDDDDADADTNDMTQPLESTDVPTQPMSATELLDDPDATHVSDTNDATQALESTDVPTQPMSATELLAESTDTNDITQPLESTDMPTRPMTATELPAETGENEQADADSLATRQVPLVIAAASPDDEATQPVAATEPDIDIDADTDAQPTRRVPLVLVEPPADIDIDTDTTRQVPLITAAAPTGDEATQPIPSTDTDATRPVPVIAAAGLTDTSTQEIPSPDDSATRALPIPAAASMAPIEPPPNPFAAPASAAAVVPPTQASDAVPPQFASQQPAPPQPLHSAAPPTQAAAAVPPPGAPNPWLQPPQPQPQQGAWGPAPQAAPAPAPGAGPGGWGPPNQPPYFPQQGPPPGKGNGGKTAAIVIAAVVAVAAVVSLVFVVTRGKHDGSSDTLGIAGHSSSSSAPSATSPSSVPGTNFPTDSASSDDVSPSDSDSDTAGDDVTDTDSADDTDSPPDLGSTFDPDSLNAFQTDKTPLELDALVPQEFTDDKDVHYTLKAGSVQPCVQTDMSSNLQDILTSNSCSKEIAASFVDDSGQYLVSVKVLPLPDQHTATTVYNDLAKQSAADFGIWCPGSGPGSSACSGDYQSATMKQYREQQHRYIILSVALAVNHSQSTEIAPWLDAAAKQAVDACGPLNWSGNQ